MRLGRGVIVGLLVLLAGCTSREVLHPSTWLDRFRKGAAPTGPDIVQIDIARIKRPIGDPYLNQGVWCDADEQVTDPERKGTLEDNGFRVGQIGGITPVGLLSLLTSEKSCVDPRRIYCHWGKMTPASLGPAAVQCQLAIQREGEPVTLAFEQARCVLEVVASLAPDGRTRLRFTPRIWHGETKQSISPTDDHSSWLLKDEQASEEFPELTFEVTVPANDYVVVGGRLDRPNTLGGQFFIRNDETPPVQRLLVIRTGRAPPGAAEPANSLAQGFTRATPLACQAAWTTARGAAP